MHSFPGDVALHTRNDPFSELAGRQTTTYRYLLLSARAHLHRTLLLLDPHQLGQVPPLYLTMHIPHLIFLLSVSTILLTPIYSTTTAPLASLCHPNTTSVICIAHHAAVIPPPFLRITSRHNANITLDNFQSTSVPNDASFNLTHSASFLVFNTPLGLSLLGSNPIYQQLFTLSKNVHEAPVYVPSQNRIVFSEFAYGAVDQFAINLNSEPPTLVTYAPQSPVLGVNGGTLHDGLIYWAVSGSKSLLINGTEITGLAPGIYSLDPSNGKVEAVVNNYYGTYLNSPNDLVFSRASGDLYFTDSIYGYQQNITLHPPALETAVYRFRPRTGELQVIEAGLVQPNGIAFGPGEKTLYVGDSGSAYTTEYVEDGEAVPLPLGYNATGPRTVYAYDTRETPDGLIGINRRAIYLAQEQTPDGLEVSREGYVVVAAGSG